MTFIFFIIFYWTFSYLFLIGNSESKETEDTWFIGLCKHCIIYIIGGFLFPIALGDILNDIIKHCKINRE